MVIKRDQNYWYASQQIASTWHRITSSSKKHFRSYNLKYPEKKKIWNYGFICELIICLFNIRLNCLRVKCFKCLAIAIVIDLTVYINLLVFIISHGFGRHYPCESESLYYYYFFNFLYIIAWELVLALALDLDISVVLLYLITSPSLMIGLRGSGLRWRRELKAKREEK